MFRNDRRVKHRIFGIERYPLDETNEPRIIKIARATYFIRLIRCLDLTPQAPEAVFIMATVFT